MLLRNKFHCQEGLEVPVNHPLATLFDQFLKERLYLKNVSERTLVWYRVAFKNYHALVPATSLPTKATLQQFVVALRERGIKPVTCNTYVGAMNAFCAWLHQEGHAGEHVKLAKLRVERRLLTLLNDAQTGVAREGNWWGRLRPPRIPSRRPRCPVDETFCSARQTHPSIATRYREKPAGDL